MKHARQDYNRIQDPEGKIPQDEPVFLLRGQDICAPVTLHFWADLVEEKGGDIQIIESARMQARAMRNWQEKNRFAKLPDMPQEELQRCRICGCTAITPCQTTAGPCSWVEPDLCSACAVTKG